MGEQITEQEIQSSIEEIERVSDPRRIATVIQRPVSPDGKESQFKVDIGIKPPKDGASHTYLFDGEAIVVWGTKERRFRGPVLDPHIVENNDGRVTIYPYEKQAAEFLESQGFKLRKSLI